MGSVPKQKLYTLTDCTCIHSNVHVGFQNWVAGFGLASCSMLLGQQPIPFRGFCEDILGG